MVLRRPLPKHLHVPNASGRFSTAQCRKAAGSLYSALTDWSTFVLLENHSYIRFITRYCALVALFYGICSILVLID